ncbi:Flp family type IVb pilin [Fontimonas sp. SYSU GA230001]|uniref:Flp family type IVb pilin n=1 Tax=Fontimonas sp. SYSU GA230001 TaxID=3142450 RepID=UPI0032B5DA8D
MLIEFIEQLRAFIKDERGASAVEYGLIVGLIAVALIAVLLLVAGDQSSGLYGLFQAVADQVTGAGTPSTP